MKNKLNILMLCHLPLNKTLGGSKVYIEAAKEYEKRNHEVTLLGSDQYCPENSPLLDENWRLENLSFYIQKYIEEHSDQYNVIEYEAYYLQNKPHTKNNVILVARSVLLELHLKHYSLPSFHGIKSVLGKIIYGSKRKKIFVKKMNALMATIQNSNFINVPNTDDQELLQKHKIPFEKIIVHPYGININNIEFEANRFQKEKICFIGTFDNRKGAVEFPQIIKTISKKYPNVTFKFLGVSGMFSSKDKILNYLNSNAKIEIIEKFIPDQLDSLLEDCKLGLFPSHLESFGFGALEMMARGIPVIGYDCPGVRELLPSTTCVNRGNIFALIQKIDLLLSSEEQYKQAQQETLKKVKQFTFEYQNSPSLEAYELFLSLSKIE